MRIVFILALAAWLPTTVAAGDAPRLVDLDRPGAMETLARDNPLHHEKIQRIFAGLFTRADRDVPRWLQTSFGAHEVSYVPVLLTSDPPKRNLAFALDGTRYHAVITLFHVKGTVVPAR